MSGLCCVVLAAGKGTRMKSNLPKVLCEILYEPMLGWVLDSVFACNINDVCVVTGYRSDLVTSFLYESNYSCEIAIQNELKGTAHALICAMRFLKQNKNNEVLILNGDSPFMNSQTIMNAYKFHSENQNNATIITSELNTPTGYGRIIRDKNQNLKSIIEECEASENEKIINEINSGAYWFNVNDLIKYLNLITPNSGGEYFLTSIIKLLIDENKNVKTYKSEDPSVALGANTLEQLEILNNIAKISTLSKFKNQGIHIPYEEKVTIGKNVQIGEGTMILSDVTILRNAKIGKNCVIGPGTNIIGGEISDNTNVIFKNVSFDHEYLNIKK